MIYTYPWFWQVALGDAPAFKRYPLWMAAYHGSTPDPDAGATLWQYTAGAKVSGIKGLVDMSKLLADPTTFDALADGTVATPWPASAPGNPVAVKAVPGVGTATVSWLPPDAGTAGITGYTVTIAPADASAPAKTLSVGPFTTRGTFTGLTNGAPYKFTVQARNAVGPGAVAAPTTTVVPQNPTALAISAPYVSSYGATPTVQGVLTRADTHAPLASVPVTVSTRQFGTSTWKWLASTTTDDAGRVTRQITANHNVEVRLSYVGAVGMQPASVSKTIWVRRLLSLTASASKFYGRGTPPIAGVRVNLQHYANGSWHIVARTKTGRYGWYAFARRAGTYRAVIAATSAFARGYSPTHQRLKTTVGRRLLSRRPTDFASPLC